MTSLIFPHFYRKISATGLWLGLIGIIGFNIWMGGNRHQLILTTPETPELHLSLAKNYYQQGLLSPAKREILLSQQLSKPINQKSDVLGSASPPLDLWESWQTEPEKIKQAYQDWQEILTAKPDYRDAYLQLSALAYQLSLFADAKKYLNQAISLNGNDQEAAKFAEYLFRF